jgi:hypothetical protein
MSEAGYPFGEMGELYNFLTRAFWERYAPGSQARLFGILFTHPAEPIAKAQIFPRMGSFHRRSGSNFDFFVAGYLEFYEQEHRFDDYAFNDLRRQFEEMTTWRYSGDTDLLLAMARFDGIRASIDFSEALFLDIGHIISDGAYPTASRLFEDIFRFCDEHPVDSNTRELSDWLGLRRVGPAALEAIVDELSKIAGTVWRKGRHFRVFNNRLPA